MKENDNDQKVKPDIVFTSDRTTEKPIEYSYSKEGYVYSAQLKIKTNFNLQARNIKQGSPVFNSFGIDFIQKYERLQQLIMMKDSQPKFDVTEIERLDNLLFAIIEEKFAVTQIDKNEGLFRQIIEKLALQQNVSNNQISLIVRLQDETPIFMALTSDGMPIFIEEELQQFSVDQVKGESKIIDTVGIQNAFYEVGLQSNQPAHSFSFVIKINYLTDLLIVNLYYNGTKDLTYGNKSIGVWLA